MTNHSHEAAFTRPPRFLDKTVVVTGSAQGIGRSVAESIAREGGRVVLGDRSALVHEVAESIRRSGGVVEAYQCDLQEYEGAQNLINFTIAKYGHVDILINNVGGTIWTKPFSEYGIDEIRQEIDRSLYPALWGCRAVVGHMMTRGKGVILNVSSIATRSVNRVPYAAAKGGVNALTASLAIEAARSGVRIVSTAPGGTEAPPRVIPRNTNPLNEQDSEWYQEIVDQTIGSTYLKRYGTLEEQVAPILFLASDEASYITGSVLPVGGGDQG